MRRRQAALRGKTRLHAPTVGEPLIVMVVDEIASLTAYVTDREAKQRITAAPSLLLSQGRAVGVLVVGAVQDPGKDVIARRDLFPTRIALRLVSADEVDMVLGRGARARGARCDQIRESLPGVGYVVLDGIPEPVRVRFTHVTEDVIAALVNRYALCNTSTSATTAPAATAARPVHLRIIEGAAPKRTGAVPVRRSRRRGLTQDRSAESSALPTPAGVRGVRGGCRAGPTDPVDTYRGRGDRPVAVSGLDRRPGRTLRPPDPASGVEHHGRQGHRGGPLDVLDDGGGARATAHPLREPAMPSFGRPSRSGC